MHFVQKKGLCHFSSQISYISRSSVWSVWIAGMKYVAYWKILSKEKWCFSRKFLWVIVQIDEKPCRRFWLSKYWSSTMFLSPFPQQQKQQPRRDWNDSFSPLSIFLPIILVSEYVEGGLVGLTSITNGDQDPNSLRIGGRLKNNLETFNLLLSKSAAAILQLILIGRFLRNLCDKNKKSLSSINAKIQSFVRPI